jgi:hypothetical protein
LNSEFGSHTPGTGRGRFGLGIEDAVILPTVLVALAARYLFKAALSILIQILDYAFPVLLQVVRFPLFTVRIIGDGVTALLRAVVRYLPVSATTREEWREVVSRHWSWLRQNISYRAFEEAVHDAFERGMAWVFRTCRMLTPRGALLVLAGAVLWLPVSFGAATALHAVLIAKAASLPAWTQLLHLLATVVAKSKLLVLPVYPAAWPQAKKHPFVQATYRCYRYFTRLRLVQKAGFRYQQMDWAIGSIRAIYTPYYPALKQQRAGKFSEKVKGFFSRWSMKFSAEYYEAKEREEAAKRYIRRQPGTDQPPTNGRSRTDT